MPRIIEILKATKAELIKGSPHLEFSSISTDTRRLKRGEVFLAIKGKHFDGHNFLLEAQSKGASAVIVERIPTSLKIDIPIIKVKDTVKALGEIAYFYRKKFYIPLIAISGSNGKTTTKEMLAHILGAKYKVLKNEGTQNNQIGLPLTLLKLNRGYDVAVVELGTNHFGEIEYLTRICSPNIGIVLNIGPAHLEFFKSLNGVYREKIGLIENLKFPAIGLLNNDDPFLRQTLRRSSQKFLVGFGIKYKSDFQAKSIDFKEGKISFLLNKNRFYLNTPGIFNIYNALASIGTCRIFGLDYPLIIEELKKFRFPPQRLEIKKKGGVIFIDDSYNSNPNSLNEALNLLEKLKVKKRKIAVLGDMLELGEKSQFFHYKLGMRVLRLCDIIIGVGNFFGKLDQIIKDISKRTTIFTATSSKEAKEILFKEVKPKKGDLVLVKGSRLLSMEEVFR